MNPWTKWILLLATPLALTNCRSNTVAPIGTITPNDPGNGNGVSLAQGQGSLAYEAPPHIFTPRQHPARSRFDPPAPNLAALPKMVQRMDQCYGGARPAIASNPGNQPIAPTRPTPTPKKKYKQVPYQPYGSGSGGAASGGGIATGTVNGPSGNVYGGATSQPQATPTPAPTTAAGKGAGSGRGDASAGMAAPKPADKAPAKNRAAEAESYAPPAPAADVATSAPALAKRDAGNEEKKERTRWRDRKKAKDEAAPSAPPASVAAEMSPAAGGDIMVAQEEPPPSEDDQYSDWGQATYLSNDDTMSLSSAQRVIFAIDKFLPVPLEHIRPHELLNYFSFETSAVQATDDFSVLPEIAQDPKQQGIYNLAVAIRGRAVDKVSRRNANLTFVVDRSGSMSDEGRMDYLKRGMRKMIGELKTGDLVNVVLFDHEVCVPLENFVVGRDKPEALEKAIDRMKPRGSTDVNAGLTRGYELADRGYNPNYNNRVVLVTDALANTGVTDTRTIAMVGKYYDDRKIRLSGVGVGTEFNDALLDKLTERGKGAYVFLGSEAEVDAVFGARFISLLETTAMDVHFQLHLPPSLRMNVFYGEESSAVKEDVQAIHYFANTSQLFLSDVMARGGKLRPQDQMMLTIEYQDPESGQPMVEERAFTLGDITREAYNIRKGRLLIAWADRLALLASRPAPMGYGPTAGTWIDETGFQQCEQGKSDLRDMAQGMNDPEVTRVLGLWDKFCSRYEQPRNPTRRVPASDPGGWPSAR